MTQIKTLKNIVENSFSDSTLASAVARANGAKLYLAKFDNVPCWVVRRGKKIFNASGEACSLVGDAFVLLRFNAHEFKQSANDVRAKRAGPKGARRFANANASQMSVKATRGGARKGAGRKPVEDKRKKYSLLLSDAEKAKLDTLCGKLTPSEYIRQKLGL